MKLVTNTKSNIGFTIKGLRVLFPAKGTLELDDKKFKDFVPFINMHVKLGNFTWVKEIVISKEEQVVKDCKLEKDLIKQLENLKNRKKLLEVK